MSGVVPRWMERLLGLEGASGQGTLWSLESRWDWAPWVTLLLALFCVGWVVAIYRRDAAEISRRARLGMATLRLAVLAILLLMVAQLMIAFQRTGLPYVVVIVDESASMGITDRYDDAKLRAAVDAGLGRLELDAATRLNLAKLTLLDDDARLLRRIARSYKLKVYLLAGAARAVPGDFDEMAERIRAVEASGESTRLGSGVRSVLADLRGTPPAALVLLTDGVNTEGETLAEAAAYARRKGVPILAVGLGREDPRRDVELSDLVVDEVVFVDDIVHFQAAVTATGYEGKQAEVVLKRRDDGEILKRAEITLGADGRPQTVRLPYRPRKEGQFEFEVSIAPRADESHADNNHRRRVVSVRKEQIRVLMVQSGPSFEFRYLKNLLERDTTIDLKTVLQESDVRYAELDRSALPVFPVRRDELFQYDVLILGDLNPSLLSASIMSNIRDFAQQKGGGVILIAGPRYMPLAFRDTPLADLVPLDLSTATAPDPDEVAGEGFVPALTELGTAMPHLQLGDTLAETETIWRELPEMFWYVSAPDPKPAARILARHPGATTPDGQAFPLVLLHYVGAGKVLMHNTDETWRWRFRIGDVLFARYWVQSIRYLARTKLLGSDRRAELSVDRRQYRRGEPVRIRVRFADERTAPATDDGVQVVVEQEGSKSRRMTLRRSRISRGIFEGVLGDARVGRHHVWMASPTVEGRRPAADFLVVAPPGELARGEMDVVELTAAAKASRGKFYRFADADRLLADLPEGRQTPIETLPPTVLWNRWWMLSLLLVLLTGEWIWRKRMGLL